MLRGGVVIGLAVIALALALPIDSSAAAPCWKRLLYDWSDGRIDNSYPVACYREALVRMPEDLQVYSSAPDDIEAALQKRVHQGAPAARSLAVSPHPNSGGSSSAWTKTLPIVGLAGAGALALAGALGLAARGSRRSRRRG